MTVTIGTTHGKTVHATFVPFEDMTRRQQAEHMVYAHGMGVDYYSHLPLRDEQHAVEAWLTGEFRGDEDGWPEPSEIVAIHADDQEYAEAEDILACKHTHMKGVVIGTATYVSFYCSEDYPEGGTWSVYREEWDYPDAPEPIDGSQEWISSHPDEAAAYKEAGRLYDAEHAEETP